MESDRWLGVEVRHLAALQAIAEEGSFGRAARRLGYTQSAVSQQIATLERIVGERIFDRPRGSRTVRLTEVGRLLLRHAEAIVARLDAARADVEALARGDAGTLRIGTFQSVGARVLPEILRRFVAEWPRVDVRLVEEPDDGSLLRAVERAELDVAFVTLPIDGGPVEVVPLLSDHWVVVVPADAETPEEPVSLRTLGELRLIGYRACRGSAMVESHIGRAGVSPDVVFRSDDNRTVQALVAAGVGAALIPRLAFEEGDPSVRVLETDAELPPRVIGLAWHRDRHRSAAARRFVELAEECCAELSAVA